MKITRSLIRGLVAAGLALGVGCDADDKATDPGNGTDIRSTDSNTPTDPEAPAASSENGAATPADEPASTGYSGTFSGDGLKLRLAGVGGTYTGSMDFQGKTFPVVARQESSGLLRGTFDSGGKKFELTGVLDGDSMSLKSSNKTYLLQRQVTGNVLAQWTLSNDAAKRPEFSGSYMGTLQGEPASLELRETGEAVSGGLVVTGHRYELTGTRTVLTVMGRLQDSKNGAIYPFELAAGQHGRLQLSLATTSASGERFLIAEFKLKSR